ncbi:MAG TPA: hypothetical protein VGH06_06475 [Candidatus Udaeobacter sp.]
MARQFKPVRFFVMMGTAAFIVCGITAFYIHRSAYGRTAEERAAYAIGERAGEQAPRDVKATNGRGVEHDGSEAFQAAGNRQSAELEPRI